MASAALDDEELALSINPSHTRRGSAKGDTIAADASSMASSATPTQATQHGQERQSQRPSNPTPHPPVRQPSGIQKSHQRLDQYQVLKTLGEGSFGKVKLAVHNITGQKVALKIISRRKVMARDMAGRIEREIQYLQLLRHPHIIKLYTVITTSSEIIMVLEYAGSELFNYIVDHGKMQEAKARRFFQQIVCAVEYCHRHKIVHRDLKPENLLLDEQMHVKIADFGLSNIMTDGNFLKTSCGSPNYAAPEVISGKLYAGPEVDVWSCGVILYVLLVGRLPFDDEYIPALFKKIAQGSYHVPSSLSDGAKDLIRKMLQVSPVHRITVQEIRQHAWFVVDMPEYLKPPVEEFIDTGVDPDKAIDPGALAPTQPPEIRQKIHNSVIGKLGKTMGYAKEDVQQALARDEPNAIKDAYLIVRENVIMRETPSFANNPAFIPYLQSPPTHAVSSPISQAMDRGSPSIVGVTIGSPSNQMSDRAKHMTTAATPGSVSEARSPVSTVGVLPSSLPDYHQAFMKGVPPAQSPPADAPPLEKPQTEEQKAATARRLKPHSRSHINLDKMNRPEGMTPINPPERKKSRPTKWQFGIRSRNQPAEAMLAIYKALKAMGADWEVPKTRRPRDRSHDDGGQQDDTISGSDDSESDIEEDGADDDSGENANSARGSFRTDSTNSSTSTRGRTRNRSRYGSWNDYGYKIPQDPWIINARFRKTGMYAPAAVPSIAGTATGSQPNSRTNLIDLGKNDGTSTAAGAEKSGSADITPETSVQVQRHDDSAYVYMTIQLYSIEREFYLVDFKCAGYERLVRKVAKAIEVVTDSQAQEGQWDDKLAEKEGWAKESDEEDEGGVWRRRTEREDIIGDGRAVEEKEVSSPFPFLDVASRLIIQLAEAE